MLRILLNQDGFHPVWDPRHPYNVNITWLDHSPLGYKEKGEDRLVCV